MLQATSLLRNIRNKIYPLIRRERKATKIPSNLGKLKYCNLPGGESKIHGNLWTVPSDIELDAITSVHCKSKCSFRFLREKKCVGFSIKSHCNNHSNKCKFCKLHMEKRHYYSFMLTSPTIKHSSFTVYK